MDFKGTKLHICKCMEGVKVGGWKTVVGSVRNVKEKVGLQSIVQRN